MDVISYPVLYPSGAIFVSEVHNHHWQNRTPIGDLHMDRHPHLIDLGGLDCFLYRVGTDLPPLTDEATTWMRDSVAGPWTWAKNGFLAFADPNDALRFKLAWG